MKGEIKCRGCGHTIVINGERSCVCPQCGTQAHVEEPMKIPCACPDDDRAVTYGVELPFPEEVVIEPTAVINSRNGKNK